MVQLLECLINALINDCTTYLILLKLSNELVINVGSLGNIRFKGGYYIYVGSSKKGLAKRIVRHISKVKVKRLHWHIDYLTSYSNIIAIGITNLKECEISNILSSTYNLIYGFGSSDCSCKAHLFYVITLNEGISSIYRTCKTIIKLGL